MSALSKYPEYEVVIGVETHVQLKTKTKIFCACKNMFGAEPNTNICKVCTGMLGSLPVLNINVVNYAIAAGLATNCSISRVSEFARKHYYYPDLPKNYQITQDDKPICLDGKLEILTDKKESKFIRIKRIHLEEDAGKSIHDRDKLSSFVDLNRAGTPLIEIVTEPDLSSAHETVFYLEELKSIVEYIGISNANMEEGSFRGDVNVSVKKKTASELGTKVELKNINSLKFIFNAIEFEIERQIELIESGGKVTQETRLWDADKEQTFVMRSKENAQDYRYLQDPDLPLLLVDEDWIERIKEALPELPKAKFTRFLRDYNLTEYEAEILTSSKELAEYFEVVAKISKLPKKASNWILRDVLGFIKENKIELSEFLIKPDMLAELIAEIEAGIINSKSAQEVFDEMTKSGKYPSIIIQEKGLEQVGSEDEILRIIRDIITTSPNQVADFKGGNARVFPYFVGLAMKALKGKGNPAVINKLLQEELSK